MSETQFNRDSWLIGDGSIAAEPSSLSHLPEFSRISPDVKLGDDVRIFAFVNLYGCSIGDNSKIGTFVEIQKNASVGRNVKVSSHTFICEGVTIEDCVAMARHVGQRAAVEHRRDRLDQSRRDSRVALDEIRQPRQHDPPHDPLGQRLAE